MAADGFGRTLHTPLRQVDPRIFTPTPHGSPTWRRAYAQHAALERINARIDNSFCFKRHNTRGQDKMTARIGRSRTHLNAGKHRQNQPCKPQNRPCGT